MAGAPPTGRQVALIEKLCRQLGVRPPRSIPTVEDASAQIDQLKAQAQQLPKPSPARSRKAPGKTAKTAKADKVSVLNPKTQRFELVSAEEARRRRRG